MGTFNTTIMPYQSTNTPPTTAGELLQGFNGFPAQNQSDAAIALSAFNDERLSTSDRLAAFSTLRALAQPEYQASFTCEIRQATSRTPAAIVVTLHNPATSYPLASNALSIPVDIWDKDKCHVPNTITGFDAKTTAALFTLNSPGGVDNTSALAALFQVRSVLSPEFKLLCGAANPLFSKFFSPEDLSKVETILCTLDKATLTQAERDSAWHTLIDLAQPCHKGFLQTFSKTMHEDH